MPPPNATPVSVYVSAPLESAVLCATVESITLSVRMLKIAPPMALSACARLPVRSSLVSVTEEAAVPLPRILRALDLVCEGVWWVV